MRAEAGGAGARGAGAGGAGACRQRGARAWRRRGGGGGGGGGALGLARIFIDIPTSILGCSIRGVWKVEAISGTVLARWINDGGSRPLARCCALSGNIWSSTASGRSCVRSCERDAAPPGQQRA